MTVAALIEQLEKMPPDAEVMHLWDGAARTGIKHVWLSRAGRVVTADEDEVCYYTDDRPASAPTAKQCQYWRTPKSDKADAALN